jgi:hypothetical protein
VSEGFHAATIVKRARELGIVRMLICAKGCAQPSRREERSRLRDNAR